MTLSRDLTYPLALCYWSLGILLLLYIKEKTIHLLLFTVYRITEHQRCVIGWPIEKERRIHQMRLRSAGTL